MNHATGALLALVIPGVMFFACASNDTNPVQTTTTHQGGAGGGASQCGNGIIDANEVCDGVAFGAETCATQGIPGADGYLGCASDCQTIFDTFCVPQNATCGNGTVEGREECDGPPTDACTDLGFDGGTLACNANCTFDLSGCTGDLCANQDPSWYGDGLCDVCTTLGGHMDDDCTTGCGADGTCASYKWAGLGTTTCLYYFGVEDPDCGTCGDGTADPTEWCDGTDIPVFCEDLGYAGGDIACDATCRLDVSACLAVLPPESICDDWLDNDQDGFIDCEDTTNCQGTAACTPGSGAVGVACTEPTNCASAAGADPTCLISATNGYCSEFCNLANDDCGAGKVCADIFSLASGNGVCAKTCAGDGECRPSDNIYCWDAMATGALICWPGAPAGWTCDPSYFGADDGCDCGCGVLDPDCADSLVGTCEYCDWTGSCSTEACPGTINATENWHC